MTGVAQAADSIEELAGFLGGEPQEAHEDEENAESQPEDEGVGEEEESESDESSEEDEEQPEDQATRKIKVPIKGEDGQETVEELDESEVISGYMRQKAFTQKTMELAEREKQAAAVVQQRVTEASQYAFQQAQVAKSAVLQLAGIRSDAELQQMAVEDPAGWIQEQQRMRQVGAVLQQLDDVTKAEQAKLDEASKAAEQERVKAAWDVLTAKGLDHAKLGDIYTKVIKAYGATAEGLGKVLDPGIALALQDAVKYRELQEKKPHVTQKVKEAERLPTAKKALPQQERVNRTLGEKFSRGKAKVNDLASFIANNKL